MRIAKVLLILLVVLIWVSAWMIYKFLEDIGPPVWGLWVFPYALTVAIYDLWDRLDG